MEIQKKESTSLFQVFLRLRPPPTLNQSVTSPERILTVEEPSPDKPPTNVVLNPPSENRRRAVEKFTFTHIFKENANQLDIFNGTDILTLIEGALGKNKEEGRDGLLATLGTYTLLGSRSQRGLIQLTLDVLFRSISKNLPQDILDSSFHASVAASDSSEAQVISAQTFLETIYPDLTNASRASRAQTPLARESNYSTTPRRILPQNSMPCTPDISHIIAKCDPNAQYAILISMYEVYNDRIFDLLAPALPTKSTKEYRRRPLLYKHTESSTRKKVVAGLRKIVCRTNKEALMVLDAGLHERQVAMTGSNSVSSRSHGFVSIEIKKRKPNWVHGKWASSSLTIVDLAGSERARDAKTQGTTLAEAGKINESLMYLGQCLQIQSDMANSTKHNLAPFRQCKLTELLFSNCFAHTNIGNPIPSSHHNSQKAIMIVMADPIGDFNATSQILRYSSLAREVTVPRIPSVTSTIISNSTDSQYYNSSRTMSSKGNPIDSERATMEIAALEIARMSDEIDCLRLELQHESERRAEVEAHAEWLSNRLIDIEAEIREECFQDMEGRIETEMRRWKATWALEADLKDEHLDRKLEIFTRSITTTTVEDEEDKENTHNGTKEDMEAENSRLRMEVEKLKRELQGRSPSKVKRLPLQENRSITSMIDSRSRDLASSHGSKILQNKSFSPTKKIQKSTSPKWKSLQDDLF
ncbi:Kinesin-like motor protein 9 [Erysiphe neolycopersici]|uniref:Kinesin-like protein n=1 Tax=Erysiphe neolycopersici TaxID=212602 RepID=A0A420HS80_9PEZI|nr:Kinesin-like motor protein 9 [Erysiphe neolycopersici]